MLVRFLTSVLSLSTSKPAFLFGKKRKEKNPAPPNSSSFLLFWNVSDPTTFKLTYDAIIFRTTNGERKRDNIVYTMELRWHENSISWASVWRWLVRFGSVRIPASSGGSRRTVQGDLPGLAAAAAAAAELSEGPTGGRGGCGRRPVHVIGAVGELRVRGLRRRAGARQRRGRGRSPGGTSGFVARGIALGTGSARAVLAFLLRVAHFHLLTVGSDSVLQRQRAILWGGRDRTKTWLNVATAEFKPKS